MCAAVTASVTARMPDSHQIRSGYTHRPEPEYFADTQTLAGRIVYQPEVYAHAAEVAAALGGRRIVDFGCGTGGKLVELADRFEIIGIDYGPNIETCRSRYDVGTWLVDDFETPGAVDVDAAGAVVVCSDVIEHLRRPEVLLEKLRAALDGGAVAVLISTPERDLTQGLWHDGPPPNVAHVREWNVRELAALLRRAGFEHGSIGLTRSNTVRNHAHTILAAYVSDPAHLAALEDALVDAALPPVPRGQGHSTVERARRKLARTIAP
jgi:SAM-dependent methyltransferase